MSWSRRRLLGAGAAAMLQGAPPVAAWLLRPASARAEGQAELPVWALDADGDGMIDAHDRARVAASIGRRRGWRLRPSPGWDPGADVTGRGIVDREALALVDAHLGVRLPPRPQIVCWHYGWYGRGRRRGERPTARFLGGAYLSTSRTAEERFNALKSEFGIDVDMLSWIREGDSRAAYDRGYLAARNRDGRRFGVLYEGTINLGSGRLEFRDGHDAARLLANDFEQIGRWLVDRTGPRLEGVWRRDGRPVLYLFGSHAWGTTHDNLPAVGRALVAAREAFAARTGVAPYLIGDEALFYGDRQVGPDRRYRAGYLDAVTRYHHYDARLVRALGGGRPVRMDAEYRRRLRRLEESTEEGFAAVRNRFTGRPLLVLPSSAAGFAKAGLPPLRASRAEYRRWLLEAWELTARHLVRRLAAAGGSGTAPAAGGSAAAGGGTGIDDPTDSARTGASEAPPVFVGSWNEEFEGHALFPAAHNEALAEPDRGGFDWLEAIRATYGLVRSAS